MGDGRPSLWRVWLDAFRRQRGDTALVSESRREVAEDRARFDAEMRAGGYREWAHSPPTGRDVVECRRMEWRGVEITHPVSAHPTVNVAGLWWRDVGGVVDVDGIAVTPGNSVSTTGGPRYER